MKLFQNFGLFYVVREHWNIERIRWLLDIEFLKMLDALCLITRSLFECLSQICFDNTKFYKERYGFFDIML